MDGVVGRIEAPAAVGPGLQLVGHRHEPGREPDAAMNGTRPQMRLGGMGGGAGDGGEEGADALMGVGEFERGRLADDDGAGLRQIHAHAGDAVDDAEAGHLLVIGEEEVDRRLEIRRQEIRHERQRQSDETLHVDRAAAIGLAILDMQRERVAAPGLALHRHHVGVPREQDAAPVRGTDRGEQRRLVAGGVRDADRGDAPAREIVLDEGDQLQIGFVAHRIEGDEPGEHVERRQALARGGGQGQWRTFFT